MQLETGSAFSIYMGVTASRLHVNTGSLSVTGAGTKPTLTIQLIDTSVVSFDSGFSSSVSGDLHLTGSVSAGAAPPVTLGGTGWLDLNVFCTCGHSIPDSNNSDGPRARTGRAAVSSPSAMRTLHRRSC
jgi:hypothetical protein